MLDASEVGPALYEPNRERMEVASLWFERESYEVNTLERLGFEPDAKALCRERRAAYRRPLQLQLALAATDLALHHAFDPTQDGAPLAWARRVLADAEGRERDPADSTVAMHPHLFSHPRGYAGRYVAYPLGEAAAEALVGQHGPGLPQRDSLRAALEQARTPALWSEQIRVDRWCEAIKRQQFGLD